jgi:hypothetical protein
MDSAPEPALGLSLERRCRSLNRAGAPCRSPVLTDGGDYCAMHSGKVDPCELGRKGGIASMAARQERAKHVRELRCCSWRPTAEPSRHRHLTPRGLGYS